MNYTNGKMLQRSISKVFPNKITADLIEVLLLLLLGAIAITLHAKLRIPMHLPGRQGVLFIAILIIGRSSSRFSFATSLCCLGASSLLFFNAFGIAKPFEPFIYLMFGVVMDILIGVASKIKYNIWTVSLACGLSWMTITILKFLFSIIFHYPENSLAAGIIYPLATHLIFGFAGGMLGFSILKIFSKK